MSQPSTTLRVYLSATIGDMQAERELLHQYVFPELRTLCEQRGLTFEVVDPGRDASLEEEAWSVEQCLNEMDRRPICFLGILGERFGEGLETIPEEVWRDRPWLRDQAGASRTALEILHGPLRSPQTARAFFYMRDPAFIDTVPAVFQERFREMPTPAEERQLGSGESRRRAEERQRRLADLKARIRASGLPVHDNCPDPQALCGLVRQDLLHLVHEWTGQDRPAASKFELSLDDDSGPVPSDKAAVDKDSSDFDFDLCLGDDSGPVPSDKAAVDKDSSDFDIAPLDDIDDGPITGMGMEAPRKAPAQEAPLYLDENVQFTVFRPRVVQAWRWYPLLAFAHLSERRPDADQDEPDPVAEVQRQAKQILGQQAADYQDVTQDSRMAVPREGELTFVPEIEGIEFNPPRRSFLWHESVHREEFRLRAHPELEGTTARGRLTVFLGNILLAEVSLGIRVDSRHDSASSQANSESSSARPYRKIFASYSHKDLAIVEEFERYAKALGDEYLRDWVHLRSGQDWNDRLLRMIEEADVFQLFWSRNAMESAYVEKEYRHALALKRPAFVRPTYWEEPLPQAPERGLPPQELLRLHFQRLYVGASSHPNLTETESVDSCLQEFSHEDTAVVADRLSATGYLEDKPLPAAARPAKSAPRMPLPRTRSKGGFGGGWFERGSKDDLWLAGKYRVLRTLAQGGMGTVYLVEDGQVRRKFVAKVSPKSFEPAAPLPGERLTQSRTEAGIPAKTPRWLPDETRAIMSLNHPRLARLVDVVEDHGTKVMVSEYIEGNDLAERLRKGPVGPAEAVAWCIQLADVLHYVHQAGFIHTDLKPASIFFQSRKEVAIKAEDFGRPRGPNLPEGSIGTPAYLAPEMIRGEGYEPRSDIYVLGVILYELLTGRPPFQGENAMAILTQVVEQKPVPPHQLNPKIDPALESLCLRCLAKDPKDRPASAAELAAELRSQTPPPRRPWWRFWG